MPEEYRIDERQRMVWARSWGVLSDDDIRRHQSRLRADPLFHPSFSQLVDCTAVTEVTLSAGTILQMGQSTVFDPSARRAYVVAKDVLFGLVRMYELHQGLRGPGSVRVFRSRNEAIAWLEVADPDAPPADTARQAG